MKLYKLTDGHGRTYNNTQWGPGITHSTNGLGDLCGPGWIHAYTSPLLAVLLNPIHAEFKNPILWEAEGVIGKNDHGLKVGTTKLTTIRKITLPTITTEHRVRFAILCAKEVCKEPQWNKWADNWLNGSDRFPEAAAEAAARTAARTAAVAAAAARAAWAAREAAAAAAAAWAESAAEEAEAAAEWAAKAAEWAAKAIDINLIEIAEKAIGESK